MLISSPQKNAPAVIPAKAGTHLDLAFDSPFAPTSSDLIRKGKIKMGPSFRWDDDAPGGFVAVTSTLHLGTQAAHNGDPRLTSASAPLKMERRNAS